MLKTSALVLLSLALPASAHAAGRPDLVVSHVRAPAAAIAPGASLKIASTAANRGVKTSGRSTTRFYLSPDPKASAAARRASRTNPRTSQLDVRLLGERRVGRLRGRRTAASKTMLTVPETLSAGAFRVLACADDRGAVRERREANQCRAASTPLTIAGTGAPMAWHSLTDALDPLDDDAVTEKAAFLQQVSCGAPVAAKRIGSAKAAITSARAALTAQVGAPAMQAFAASPEAATPDASTLAATTMLSTGNLGAALVASLRAAELAPRDGDALGNAAALAVSAGMPNEALALLDGAAVADRPAPVGLGLDRRAAAAQTRGMALLQLGKDQAALGALAAAAGLDPSLQPEAASGQAAQALCAGGVPAAVTLLRRAGRRTPVTPETPVAPLDESHGRASALRPIELPGTPGEAIKMEDQFQAVRDNLDAEVGAYHEAEAANNAERYARELSPIQQRRESAIIDRVLDVQDRPAIKALDRRLSDAQDLEFKNFQRFWGNGEGDVDQQYEYNTYSLAAAEACRDAKDSAACEEQKMRETCTPGLRAFHQTWLAQVIKTREIEAQRVAALSAGMTAIAAHLEDPAAREQVRLMIVSIELAHAGGAPIEAAAWARVVHVHENTCVKSPDGPDAGGRVGQDGAPQIALPDPCNSVSKNLSFVIDPSKLLKDLPGGDKVPKLPKVKVSCERVQVSYEFGPSAWAQPFAQVDWKFKAGTVTAFAGVRGKVEFSDRSENLKGGLYLTVSRDGVQDVGWRTSASTSTMIGPVLELTAKQDFDVSFVPGYEGVMELVR